MRSFSAVYWTASLAALGLAAMLAAAFALMVASLDPSDMITAGVEPWSDAISAAAAFAGYAMITAIGLRLWHSTRFKPLSLVVLGVDIGLVGWASLRFYAEYL